MNGIGRIFKELKQAREAQSLLAPQIINLL